MCSCSSGYLELKTVLGETFDSIRQERGTKHAQLPGGICCLSSVSLIKHSLLDLSKLAESSSTTNCSVMGSGGLDSSSESFYSIQRDKAHHLGYIS